MATGRVARRLPAVPDLPALRNQDTKHDPHHRGLPRRVRSQQTGEDTRQHSETDPVKGRAVSEGMRHLSNLQHRGMRRRGNLGNPVNRVPG
jgi:hypothetical protein